MDKIIKRGSIVLLPMIIIRVFLGNEIIKQNAIIMQGELWDNMKLPWLLPLDIYSLTEGVLALDFFMTILMAVILSAWLIHFAKSKNKKVFGYILMVVGLSFILETVFYFYTSNILLFGYHQNFWGKNIVFIGRGLVFAIFIFVIHSLVAYGKSRRLRR